MAKAPTIKQIEYTHGQVSSMADLDRRWEGETLIPEQPSIPSRVLQVMKRERIWELEGDFGPPSLGSPIEVDILQIQTERGEQVLRLFNRGLLLFTTEDENIKRLHSFFAALGSLGEADSSPPA